jgi:CubicO group peptidase (beta-lactamase class C family)
MIRHGFAGIEDYRIFPTRPLQPSAHPFIFDRGRSWQPPAVVIDGREEPLPEFLRHTDTVAFLVIKNDLLLYEQYLAGYRRDSLVTTFSITKAVLSMLVGAAIADGRIGSVKQPVTDFVPELRPKGYDRVRIEHLLQMTAGMDYREYEGNPFSLHSRFYYLQDLKAALMQIGLKREPGTQFEYQSGASQLLGLVLIRALGGENITEYLQRRIWTPLGMEFAGSWSLDSAEHGFEKVYCGLNATAVDLAKIGRLYLRMGTWDGERILPRWWIEQSTRGDDSNGSVLRYRYGWWIMSERYSDYRAEGHLGQFLYINPRLQVIIVRLGKDMGGLDWNAWKQVLTWVAEKT